MVANPLHVTVTGAAGQIGYALVHRIASGSCSGPTSRSCCGCSRSSRRCRRSRAWSWSWRTARTRCSRASWPPADLKKAFDGTRWALLVGSIPRKAGMERGDLLKVNGGIFGPQGQAINDHAARDVRVLVVGNPCNTNCLIARSNAPDVPADRWFAMTRLDENRAKTQLAKKAGVQVKQVTNVAIWGNHSATQFPDFAHATHRRQARARRDRRHRLAAGPQFIETVQKRGAAVIDKRGALVGRVRRPRGDRVGQQRLA